MGYTHGEKQILKDEIQEAKQVCISLFTKYPERMLLHGDLHHDNILQTEDNRYLVIDPKGVDEQSIKTAVKISGF